jgi:hypothetical protein
LWWGRIHSAGAHRRDAEPDTDADPNSHADANPVAQFNYAVEPDSDDCVAGLLQQRW